MEINIFEGDITQFEADALVNAANNRLWMSSGVAGALKRTGGLQIEDEAIRQGPVKVGEAVATTAGRLKARYVIHAAVMGPDLSTDAAIISAATLNSLILADKLGIKSIVFPALGTGVGGFPPEECARIMLKVVAVYGTGKTGLDKALFVLYGNEPYRIFQAELARQMKNK